MRKLGALDDAMENLGPFALWWRNLGKLETLNKAMGIGSLVTWWEKWEIGPLMTQWNITLRVLWWRNGQIRDPSDGEIGAPDDLMGKLGALDH